MKQKTTHRKKTPVIEDIPSFDTFTPEEQPSSSKKPKTVAIILAVAALIGLAIFGFVKRGMDEKNNVKTTLIPSIVKKLDAGVELKSVDNFHEASGMYVFDLQLSIQGQTQKFTSYMTKDGKIFFTGGIVVADLDKKPAVQGAETTKVTCDTVKKADNPSLTAYVVSQCPYGLQMQRVMKMAIEKAPEMAAYLKVSYIGSVVDGKVTSMHGEKEAAENLRQICIREEQKERYWPYVSCYMKEGKGEACEGEAGVDSGKLQACIADAGKGVSYAKKDFALSDSLAIGSSPTLLVNDNQIVSEFDFGGRTADALKQVLCCSGNAKQGFCSTTLPTDSVAPSFSSTDTGSGTGTAANCN